ncbi:hypothetical protein SAMN05216276_1001296 [Streptosporangium subroseum]|uniref:Uncharacterized protein n=1 Tax=Streptosporangium subroseum TaxID=106412 RepID=A0A239AEF6_9ACTN|nr:hypothetical protein SAMN05216276_1001296 [Streptosporangium subroseum]
MPAHQATVMAVPLPIGVPRRIPRVVRGCGR